MNLFQGGGQWHTKRLEVSQISQTLFEQGLLSLIEGLCIIAHKFPEHKHQQGFQILESSAKPLLRRRTEFLWQVNLSSWVHFQSDGVLPSAPRTRLRIADTIILSSLSKPANNANPQNDA